MTSVCLFFFLFFKQKTAYEMRISDWSSDVCSSDLVRERPRDSALWVDIARFRDANADTLGARDAVDYAIELDGKNSAALAYTANLVRTQGGLNASLGWYEKALAADPDDADALIDQEIGRAHV